MGGKSKRYFQDRAGSRSRSPTRESNHNSKSRRSSSSLHNANSRHSKSSRSHAESSGFSKFVDNKSASDRLKKSIQEQTIKSSSTEPAKAPLHLSVEEQMKRANAISEINYNPFVPKSFLSNRTTNSQVNSINLLDIPLPIDDSSWRDNSKLLVNPAVSSHAKCFRLY